MCVARSSHIRPPQSLRGGGAICFGHKAVTNFLQQQGYSYIMRAHEAHAEGVAVSKGARVFTVFSTSKDHNQGSQAMAGCILVDFEKMKVINRSPAYKNKFVHRRDSVSLAGMSEAEIAQRATLGLVTAVADGSDDEYDVSQKSSTDDGDYDDAELTANDDNDDTIEIEPRRSSVDVESTHDRGSGSSDGSLSGSSPLPMMGGGEVRAAPPSLNRLSGCREEDEEDVEAELEGGASEMNWEEGAWKNGAADGTSGAAVIRKKSSKMSKLFGGSKSKK